LTKVKTQSARRSLDRLQRLVGERVECQARRIPWQRLFEARNEYIDWQEFYLWVRSILAVGPGIPDWVVETLNARCPGFLESEGALTPKAAKTRPLHLRLEDWISDLAGYSLKSVKTCGVDVSRNYFLWDSFEFYIQENC